MAAVENQQDYKDRLAKSGTERNGCAIFSLIHAIADFYNDNDKDERSKSLKTIMDNKSIKEAYEMLLTAYDQDTYSKDKINDLNNNDLKAAISSMLGNMVKMDPNEREKSFRPVITNFLNTLIDNANADADADADSGFNLLRSVLNPFDNSIAKEKKKFDEFNAMTKENMKKFFLETDVNLPQSYIEYLSNVLGFESKFYDIKDGNIESLNVAAETPNKTLGDLQFLNVRNSHWEVFLKSKAAAIEHNKAHKGKHFFLDNSTKQAENSTSNNDSSSSKGGFSEFFSFISEAVGLFFTYIKQAMAPAIDKLKKLVNGEPIEQPSAASSKAAQFSAKLKGIKKEFREDFKALDEAFDSLKLQEKIDVSNYIKGKPVAGTPANAAALPFLASWSKVKLAAIDDLRDLIVNQKVAGSNSNDVKTLRTALGIR